MEHEFGESRIDCTFCLTYIMLHGIAPQNIQGEEAQVESNFWGKHRLRNAAAYLHSSNSRVGVASSFSTLFELSVAAATFATAIATARVLGSAGRGELAAATTLYSLVFFLGNMGLSNANVFFGARGTIKTDVLFGNSLAAGAVFGFGTVLITLMLTRLVPGITGNIPDELIYAGCFFLPLMFLDLYLNYIMVGKGQIIETGIATVVSRFLSSLIVVVVCLVSDSVLLVFICSMAYVPIRLVFDFILMHRASLLTRPKVNMADFKTSLAFSTKGRGTEIFRYLNLRLDVFILNYLASVASLGVYSLAVLISEVCWYPAAGVTKVLFPHVSARSAHAPDEMRDQVITWSRAVLLVTLILGTTITIVGILTIPTVFGSDFVDARIVLVLLFPGTVLFSSSRVLIDALAGFGAPHLGSAVALTSFGVTLTLDLLLIPRYGINGAAIASTFAYATSAIVASIWFGRLTGAAPFAALLIGRREVMQLIAVIKSVRIRVRSTLVHKFS
jgi:O-antigen/teichoic acid export membrane protein